MHTYVDECYPNHDISNNRYKSIWLQSINWLIMIYFTSQLNHKYDIAQVTEIKRLQTWKRITKMQL